MEATFDIYLASASPRRRELLDQIAVRYKVIRQDVAEEVQAGESPSAYVQRLALEKARAGWNSLSPGNRKPVLGADTAVVMEGCILGKPRDRNEGLAMLRQLSGRCHEVYSAVAIVAQTEVVKVNISRVCFATLDSTLRAAYWDSGECSDKAGAYAIQGMAAAFIRRLEGSYSGVMGLPLFETAALLKQFEIEFGLASNKNE
ncbi:Septum formation protein Maf [hydrothermal vent metagenome]|uniref:Septum formation protein Maf n=1 Tax=hydrothermal vent metagenome TaxID=652676 RepID=A0A3B1C4P7_9ZZZZ